MELLVDSTDIAVSPNEHDPTSLKVRVEGRRTRWNTTEASFGKLCMLAEARAVYLKRLPPAWTATLINHGLQRFRAPCKVRLILSEHTLEDLSFWWDAPKPLPEGIPAPVL